MVTVDNFENEGETIFQVSGLSEGSVQQSLKELLGV